MFAKSQTILAAAATVLLFASVNAQHVPRTTTFQGRQASPSSTAAPQVTAVTGCHMHGTTQFCIAGVSEYQVKTSGSNLPSSYTACHYHGSAMYCLAPSGDDVELIPEGGGANAASTTAATTAATPASFPSEITSCHLHGSTVYCMAGTAEYQVVTTPTATTDVPAAFTGCHSHGSDSFCVNSKGEDVQVLAPGQAAAATPSSSSGEPQGKHCHFHAGVEHCVGPGESESGGSGTKNCARVERDYDIPLRIGLLFVVLVTSAIGVFTPIFLTKWSMSGPLKWILMILKQFGTGVIIATAFVHLFTHADLMFSNKCLGQLQFEGTTAAIFTAGLFLSFLIEFCSHKFAHATMSKKAIEGDATTAELHRQNRKEIVSIFVLEAGIIFHSIIIGVTLVVSGDSFFKILFAVIVFHQMFEGIALGSRIASAGNLPPNVEHMAGECPIPSLSLYKKCLMALAFALVTPVGMAIGIGVLQHFNGNDPSTIIAIGTLDAVSAGILAWVGIVEMWAGDWMFGGEMDRAEPLTATIGGIGLVAGIALMSFIGKWA